MGPGHRKGTYLVDLVVQTEPDAVRMYIHLVMKAYILLQSTYVYIPLSHELPKCARQRMFMSMI